MNTLGTIGTSKVCGATCPVTCLRLRPLSSHPFFLLSTASLIVVAGAHHEILLTVVYRNAYSYHLIIYILPIDWASFLSLFPL